MGSEYRNLAAGLYDVALTSKEGHYVRLFAGNWIIAEPGFIERTNPVETWNVYFPRDDTFNVNDVRRPRRQGDILVVEGLDRKLERTRIADEDRRRPRNPRY
jgi:hypothetical protein